MHGEIQLNEAHISVWQLKWKRISEVVSVEAIKERINNAKSALGIDRSTSSTQNAEVLLGVRYKYLIFMESKESKDTTLTAYLSWIQIARHFGFDPRTVTVTEKGASIFPGKTSLYTAPSCLKRYDAEVCVSTAAVFYPVLGWFWC